MSLTLAPPVTTLPAAARTELAAAMAVLEGVSLPVRIAGMVGGTVDALKRRLPAVVQDRLDEAVRAALETAMRVALGTAPGPAPQPWLHRGLIAASGLAGGAFGLPGTLVELPVSTTLLLRQVASIAAEQGEDLADPLVQAECLKVFALGGNDPQDDAAESGYFALRIALAQTVQGAVGRSLGQLMPSFLGAIAARFGGPVAVKLSAQAAPLVGAAGGAAVNLAFLEHFRGIAHAHFTVRRLERGYGPVLVRAAYDRMKDHAFAA